MDFKYSAADWVKQFGLPQHHLRIIFHHVDSASQRWYQIFDTTLRRGHADYDWTPADVLEANSELVMSAENSDHARAILQRCANLQGLSYSIPQRQDCESLQGYIQTAREQDRWSTQVWTAIGTAFASVLVVATIKNQQEEERRKARRKRSRRNRS